MSFWMLALALAPFAIAFAVVCLRSPMRVALPVYAALIPFGGAIAIGPSRYGSASSLVGLLLAAGLVAQLLNSSRVSARRLPSAIPVWVFFLSLAAATSLWTINRAATVSGLLILTSLIGVYVLAAMSHVDRTVVRRTETALLVGGMAAVGYGLYQLVAMGGFIGGRFGNGLLGPNIQAVTLLVPMAIALHRTFSPTETAHRLAHLVVAASMLAGVLATGSRTGSLGAGLVVLAMLLVGERQARKGLGVTLVVGLVVAAVVWIYHPLGLAERTFETASSSSGRLDIWRVGLAACSDYCGFGSGWGTFPQVYEQTQASVPGARVLVGEGGSYQPHNLWLLALIETGIVGALLLTVGLVGTLFQAVRLPLSFRAPAVGAMVGLVFGVLFLSSMEFKIFWLVLLLVAMYRNASDVEPASETGFRKDTLPA